MTGAMENTTDEEVEEEKTAIPLELFFDLVFVFAITQVVGLIVSNLTLTGVLHGVLVLALLWWAWGVWTWTTNSIDLEPRAVRVGVLVSMVGIFLIAHAVPFAFDGRGLWVAGGYASVRLLAAVIMYHGTADDPVQRTAFWTYMPVSFAGPLLIVIGGFAGDHQQWWWLGGFLAELAAAAVAGRADWHVDAGHFAERHGLIVIIALGEAIIAVGATLVDLPPSADLALLLGVGLAGAAALWWAYFDRLEEAWEGALRDADEHETGHLARDVYSIGHFPMIVGIVFYAVALEEAFHDPTHPLEPVVANLFVTALGLYLLSMVAVTYRAYGTVLYERIIFVIVTSGIVFGWPSGSARIVVLLSTMLLLITMAFEYARFRRRHWIQPRQEASRMIDG